LADFAYGKQRQYLRPESGDDGCRVPDELWERMQPLSPPGKPHPWSVYQKRVDDRQLLKGILFALRTGCQWEALNANRICKRSTAHDR